MNDLRQYLIPSALLRLLLVLTSAALSACGEDAGQASPAGTSAALLDIGYQIGPQPGADLPRPEIRNPYRGDSEALIEGRRLFVWYNCAGCHGTHAGGGMGPTHRDQVWRYGGSDAAIFNSIAQGRSLGMPAWGEKVPRDQIWKLVAYIQSLRTPREPSPPPTNPSYPEAPE